MAAECVKNNRNEFEKALGLDMAWLASEMSSPQVGMMTEEECENIKSPRLLTEAQKRGELVNALVRTLELDIDGQNLALFLQILEKKSQQYRKAVNMLKGKPHEATIPSHMPKTGQTDTSDAVALMKGFGLSDADWNLKVSDTHVIEISGSFCMKWRKLYPLLGLKEIVAYDADRNNFDETEKKMAFFNEWKQQKAYEATYKNLVHALLRVGAKDDAVSVCEMLAQSLGKKIPKLQPTATTIAYKASPATIPPADVKKAVDFNEDLASDQLYEYLIANKMPKNDAQRIKDLDIGGAAFLHFGEDFWKENGISTVGLFYISHIKAKKICMTPDAQVQASTQISDQPSSPPPIHMQSTSASDRRLTEREDYSWIVRKLTPYASKWKRIGEGLGFLHSELSSIEAKPMLLPDAPDSFLGKMLADWLQWAPRDHRGSTNYATLHALRMAVDQAKLGLVAHEL